MDHLSQNQSPEGDARLLTVNPYWLEVPLDPLAGLADGGEEDLEPFEGVSVDNEPSYRDVIRKRIVPYINSMNSESITHIKNCIQYYLNKENVPWGRVLDSLLIPFDCPRSPRDFFLWIWEECFPNECWAVDDLSGYVVAADIDAPRLTIRFVAKSDANVVRE